MISNAAFWRVMCVRYRDNCGSAFTIDVDQKQYVITARHLVKDMPSEDIVMILHERQWKRLPVTPISCAAEQVDIAVLCPNQQMSDTLRVGLGTDGMVFAQDVYFLGYPFGLYSDMPASTPFAVPFVKKGIISAIEPDASGIKCLYVDGHNNPGFSGGPVVFNHLNNPFEPRIAGVVTGYRFSEQRAYQQGIPIDLVFRENTGILIAHDITYALDAIRSDPRGFPVPPPHD